MYLPAEICEFLVDALQSHLRVWVVEVRSLRRSGLVTGLRLSRRKRGLQAESVFEVVGWSGCSLTGLSCGRIELEICTYTCVRLWKIDCFVWRSCLRWLIADTEVKSGSGRQLERDDRSAGGMPPLAAGHPPAWLCPDWLIRLQLGPNSSAKLFFVRHESVLASSGRYYGQTLHLLTFHITHQHVTNTLLITQNSCEILENLPFACQCCTMRLACLGLCPEASSPQWQSLNVLFPQMTLGRLAIRKSWHIRIGTCSHR